MIVNVALFVLVIVTLTQRIVCRAEDDLEVTITDKEYASLPQIFHLDDYDRCLVGDKSAIYCNVHIALSANSTSNISNISHIIEVLNNVATNYNHSELRHGVCLHQLCPNLGSFNITGGDDRIYGDFIDDLSECFAEKYNKLGLTASVLRTPNSVYCENRDSKYDIDSFDLSFTITLIILKVTITLATIYGAIFKSRLKNSKFLRILECFSIHQNWQILLSKNYHYRKDTNLLFLSGLRFILMFLIIFVNSIVLQLSVPILNTQYVEQGIKKVPQIVFQLIPMITSTYFIISGLLLGVKLFRKETIRLRYVCTSIIIRILRILPVIVIIIGFTSTIAVHLSMGPNWHRIVETEYRNCRDNGWTNLIFLNNYINLENQCLQTTWAVAALIQMHILAILIVPLIFFFKKYSKFLLLVLIAVCTPLPAFSAYFINSGNNFKVTSEFLYSSTLNSYDYLAENYMTHNNLIFYFFGLFFGMMYTSYECKKLFTKQWHTFVWILLIFASLSTVILFGVLLEFEQYENRLIFAIFQSVSRFGIAFGLGLLIFGVTQGKAVFLRNMLTWTPLCILGKLSFATYITHYILIKIRLGDTRYPTYVSTFSLIFATIGDITVSFFASIGLYLNIELPIYRLIKIARNKPDEITDSEPELADSSNIVPVVNTTTNGHIRA